MKEKKNPEELSVEIVFLRNGQADARSKSKDHDSGIQTLSDKEQVYQNLYRYLHHQSSVSHNKIQITRAQMVADGLYMETVRADCREKWHIRIPNITSFEKFDPDGDYQRLNQFVQDYKNRCLQEELALGKAAQEKLKKQHIRNVKIRDAAFITAVTVGMTALVMAAFVRGARIAMERDGFVPPESSSTSDINVKTSDEVLEEMINTAANSISEEEPSKQL